MKKYNFDGLIFDAPAEQDYILFKDHEDYVSDILDHLENTDQLDIGASICADILKNIAQNGRNDGKFGNQRLEEAAQEILKLRAKIKELENERN